MSNSRKNNHTDISETGRVKDSILQFSGYKGMENGVSLNSMVDLLRNFVFLMIGQRIIYVNDHSERLLGYTAQELFRSYFDYRKIIESESLKAFEHSLSTHREGREIEPYSCTLVRKDGGKIDALINTEVIKIQGSNVILGEINDLASFRFLDSHLKQNRELAESYFDNAAVIMLVLDKDGKVNLVNRNGAEILGYKVEDIIDKNWFKDFIPVDMRAEVRSIFDRIVANDNDFCEKYENTVLTKNCAKKIIEWRNSLIHDIDGNVIGVLSSGLDVTTERAASRALYESEKSHRSFVDNVPIGIFRSTPGGRILMANTAFMEMVGYDSFEELAGVNANKDLYHPDTPRRKFQHAVEADGYVSAYQAKLIRKDGKVFHGREYVRAVRDEKGRTLYYEGTIEDISDRVEAESNLDYRIRLENLIARVSTKFVNLAPDQVDQGIRNSLKSVGGFIKADRAYVCLFRDEDDIVEYAYKWDASDDFGAEFEHKYRPSDHLEWTVNQIRDKKIIRVSRVEDLPPEANNERDQLESDDVQSTIMIPLVCGTSVLGFAGFEYVWNLCEWSDEELSLLKLISQIVASALDHKRIEEELLYRLQLEELLTSISARFVGISPEKVNNEITRALSGLGEFLEIDRCVVYGFRNKGKRVVALHEWHNDEKTAMDSAEYQMDQEGATAVLGRVFKGETLNIASREELPDFMKDEAAFMKNLNIISMLCLPFSKGKHGKGFLALYCEKKRKVWPESAVSLLRMVAELLGNAIGHRLTSQALEKERILMNSLMHTIPDHIYFKDKEGKFLRSNEAHASYFGLMQEEMIGKTDYDLFEREHSDRAKEDEHKVMESGKPIVGKREETTLLDGTKTWHSTTKVPLFNADGNIVGTFGISRDITEHVKAEEERLKMESRMQQTQKLESLGVLSGGIAHDFNNLLMGILGNIGLALMEMSDDSSAWNYIKEVETIALRAADLTNQMLTYSGKSQFSIKPLDLSSLVSEMANLLKVSISDKIELDYSFDKNMPAVEGDESQIRQVVMNLITNASDAVGDAKGKISVRTGVEYCDECYLKSCYMAERLEGGQYAYVVVSDTGCGMDSKTLAKIFDPFFTTKISGRGLGLAATLGIVRGHKGALKVYTEVGKGTEFKVLFPISEKKVETEVDTACPATKWRGEGKILIVDDDDVVRTVSEQIVSKLGFSVVTACDCASGSAVLHKEKDVSAAILDVTLPDTDGQAVLDIIRKIDPDIPVILMSGYNEERATDGLEQGTYNGFLQKPFNAESLASQLKKIMENQ